MLHTWTRAWRAPVARRGCWCWQGSVLVIPLTGCERRYLSLGSVLQGVAELLQRTFSLTVKQVRWEGRFWTAGICSPLHAFRPLRMRCIAMAVRLWHLPKCTYAYVLLQEAAPACEAWARGVLKLSVSHPDLGPCGIIYLDLLPRWVCSWLAAQARQSPLFTPVLRL